jgi:hypothetical protein
MVKELVCVRRILYYASMISSANLISSEARAQDAGEVIKEQ